MDNSLEKKCIKCNKIKLVTEFLKGRNECNECRKKRTDGYVVGWADQRSLNINVPTEKICKDCNEVKPINDFNKDKHRKDGRSHICKNCTTRRHQKMVQRWRQERNQRTELLVSKKCAKCNHELPISKFTKNINSKDGMDSICKDCNAKRTKEYKVRWKSERMRNPIEITQKECLSCHRVLPASGFYPSNSRKDGLSFYCRECELKKQKESAKKWEEKRLQGKIDQPKKIKCIKCHKTLPISKFSKNRKMKHGIHSICNDCEKRRHHGYMEEWKKERSQSDEIIAAMECIKCHKVLPISSFSHNKRRKIGWSYTCLDCERARLDSYIVKWAEERANAPDDNSFTLFPKNEKVCSNCHRTLPLTFFYEKTRSKDGRVSWCIDCSRKKAIESREKRKHIKRKIPKQKTCPKCNRTLPSSMFHKSDGGLASYCKDCKKIMYKEYLSRPEIKKRLKKQWKEYRQRPEVKQREREWAREYAERPYVKQKREAYMKEYLSRPEVKERRKQYNKEYYKRPEVKERMKLYHQGYQKKKKTI
ncbi:MAG: hypothetical protein JSW62_02740 [Thermoplasmatales archaeon]|nr:MAG: hypothetical protein JSW62_02740 [Thermoplasmatales archaeon]